MTQRFWSGSSIAQLEPHQIFVFGANPEFRHGAGAAKAALAFGAKYGSGRGIVGQTYGLVTKNLTANFYEKETGITYRRYGERSVSPEQIKTNIAELYACARANPHLDFLITYQYLPNQKRSLNGYNSQETLEMFTSMPVPDNVLFHDSYGPHLSAAAAKAPEKKYTFFFHLTSVFSNFHPAAFVYKNVQFISNEQFMMYCKAKQFKDEATAKAILKVNDHPLAQQFLQGKLTSQQIVQQSNHADAWNQLMQGIKKLGRQVANYDDAVWSDKRKTAVCVGAREKFTQNPDMAQELLATKGTHLAEASKYDKIWGIGLSEADAKKLPEALWPGLNLLGEVLELVRDHLELQPVYSSTPSMG